MTTNYRGFDIQLSSGESWVASITNLRTGRTWCKGVEASLGEGQDLCVKRAKNLIDTFIALRG